MSEWWTYRPSDFLMFAPRTYWRMFELQNLDWWPVHLVLLAGLLSTQLGRGRATARARRAAFAILSVGWGFVAATLLLQRYAPINWAATFFAAGFAAGALCLAGVAFRADVGEARSAPRRHAATLLVAYAAVGPLLTQPVFGRPWLQAELFGLAPDPTVIATLAVLLGTSASGRGTAWLLRGCWAAALAWALVSVATLWTMQAAEGWSIGLSAAVAAGSALMLRRDEPAKVPEPRGG